MMKQVLKGQTRDQTQGNFRGNSINMCTICSLQNAKAKCWWKYMCCGLDIIMCEPVMGRYIHWPGYERTYQTGTKYQPQTNTCLVGTWGNTSFILGLYWSQYQVHSIYTCHKYQPKISLGTDLIPGNVQKLIPAWHSYEHYEPNKQRWVLLALPW